MKVPSAPLLIASMLAAVPAAAQYPGAQPQYQPYQQQPQYQPYQTPQQYQPRAQYQPQQPQPQYQQPQYQTNTPVQSAPLAPPANVPSAPSAGTSTNAPPTSAPPPSGSARQQPPPGAPRPGARDAFPGPAPAAPPPTTTTAAPPSPGTPSPAGAPGSDSDVVVVQPPTEKIANPTAVYAGLDKITGRITSFEVGMGDTVQFGSLQVTPRACYTRPPTEPTNTTSFTEVNEITLKGEARRIFTGWMFASSPGLHGVEHPIFDVWLTDCKATPPATVRSAGQK